MKIGFLGLLTIIFVVAKLAGIIAWSWWLVFAPVLVEVGFTILMFLFILLIALIAVALR